MKLTETQKTMVLEALDSNGDGLVSYSGRGMYGKHCASLRGSMYDINSTIAAAINSLVNDVINETHDCDENNDLEVKKIHSLQNDLENIINYILCHQKIDNMGREYVVYWESLPMLEDIEEEVETE